jgi:hypothetical protein
MRVFSNSASRKLRFDLPPVIMKGDINGSPDQSFQDLKGQTQNFSAYDAGMQLLPVPHESRFVTTPYGRTHVIACGPEDAFPLVLLHEGQASSTMWFPNIAQLCGKFHVLALNTPGEPRKRVPTRQKATRHECGKEGRCGSLDD